jgi:hypothetical protein
MLTEKCLYHSHDVLCAAAQCSRDLALAREPPDSRACVLLFTLITDAALHTRVSFLALGGDAASARQRLALGAHLHLALAPRVQAVLEVARVLVREVRV